MIAFIDTEYKQRGEGWDFVSIGIIREDGQTLHRISDEANLLRKNKFFHKHVWPLIKDEPRYSLISIQYAVREILQGVHLLVSRSGKTDHEIVEWLSGMKFPLFDVQTVWQNMDCPVLPERDTTKHHALLDADYHRLMFEALMQTTQVIACPHSPVPPRKAKQINRYRALEARVNEMELTICT